jgi:large subunit ribosomal protein L10
MALSRAKKSEKLEQLTKDLAGSTSAIVGTFSALTVSQDFELRKTVRAAGGRYRVLKNKLASRASQGTEIEAALQGLKGVSSVAYTSGDPVALAKALNDWVKENSQFTFKLGIVDGKVLDIEEIKQLASMPGKSEIYAKLLFLINAPAQRLVTVMNAAGRDLAVVINQGVEKGKFGGSAAAPVAEAAPAVAEAAPAVAEAAPAAEAAPEAAAAPEATPEA